MTWSISGNLRRLKRKSLPGQLVLVVLAVQLLFFGSFCAVELPTATQPNLTLFIHISGQNAVACLPAAWQQEINDRFPALAEPAEGTVRYSPYVPVAPLAVFVGYALGVPLGFVAALIFFFVGLAGSHFGLFAFAAGGGLDYYRQPTFGYLIGMVLASWFSGRVTLSAVSSVRQLLAVLGGLLLIHAIGLVYLLACSTGVWLLEGDTKWQPWLFENIRNLSWYALPYDALFSLALVGCGAPFRWLTAILTAPDIGMRPKPRWDRNLEQVSS